MHAVACPRCQHPQPIQYVGPADAYQCPVCGQLFRAPSPNEPAPLVVVREAPRRAQQEPPRLATSLGRSYLHAVAIAAGLITTVIAATAGVAIWYRSQDRYVEPAMHAEARQAAQKALRQQGYEETADIYRIGWAYPAVKLEMTARKGERLHDVTIYMLHAQFGQESHFQIDLIEVDGVEVYRRKRE